MLPTESEQEVLNLSPGEVSRIWREEGFSFIRKAEEEQREAWWHDLISGCVHPKFEAYVQWFRALPDTAEEDVLMEVVIDMYPGIYKAVMAGWIPQDASASYCRELQSKLDCLWDDRCLFSKSGKHAPPSIWFRLPDTCLPVFVPTTREGFLQTHAADYLIMHTRHGKSEGIAVSTMTHCKIAVTAVDGPSNYDPTDGAVDFEPGSRSVQAVLAYRHGVPPLVRLLIDIMGLRLLRQARRKAGTDAEGYRTDGKPVVPLLPSGLDLWITNPSSR